MEPFAPLAAYLVFGLVMAGVAIYQARRRQRMLAALAGDIGTDRCIACAGTELVEQHPQAFVCSQCGYEQGSGWELRRESAHLERLAAFTPKEARQHAERLLRDARLALLSATAPMRRPTMQEGSGNSARTVIHPDLLDAAQDLEQSWKNLQEASLVDPGVAAALEAAGFSASTSPPDCSELYDVATVEWAAQELGPVVRSTAHQVGQAMKALGLEA